MNLLAEADLHRWRPALCSRNRQMVLCYLDVEPVAAVAYTLPDPLQIVRQARIEVQYTFAHFQAGIGALDMSTVPAMAPKWIPSEVAPP